ncbi:glycosyltransferase family 2 protein [Streptomyces sp. NRRL F-5135]|uniref:glycosyltransferase family 2 protein n=1 Tax=Streptomyces sp. NRRL F-5135 TaxID=1463858 RepID=UPI0004C78F34|nr:glycosyltransferase [Streptomyces sp. NRRL F-5135]
MPTISVITAVYDGGHQYLPDAYASLRAQPMPDGWAWEWLIQEDGRTGRPRTVLPSDERIRYSTGARGGAGVARTVGLARANGSLARALDADDLLTEGALARDIEELTRHPEAGWCISGCLDLLPDGRLIPGPYDPPPGPLPYAQLRAQYEAGMFPVVGTHLTARTDLVRAVGGWPALPALEALALVLICASVAPGRMVGTPGGVYRKHPAQSTAQPDYHRADEFAALRAAILTRLDALGNSQWRWSPQAEEGAK